MLRSIGWIAASLLVCLSAGHCWAGQSFCLQTGGSRELCQNDSLLARKPRVGVILVDGSGTKTCEMVFGTIHMTFRQQSGSWSRNVRVGHDSIGFEKGSIGSPANLELGLTFVVALLGGRNLNLSSRPICALLIEITASHQRLHADGTNQPRRSQLSQNSFRS